MTGFYCSLFKSIFRHYWTMYSMYNTCLSYNVEQRISIDLRQGDMSLSENDNPKNQFWESLNNGQRHGCDLLPSSMSFIQYTSGDFLRRRHVSCPSKMSDE
jgi:hypothetical protein